MILAECLLFLWGYDVVVTNIHNFVFSLYHTPNLGSMDNLTRITFLFVQLDASFPKLKTKCICIQPLDYIELIITLP